MTVTDVDGTRLDEVLAAEDRGVIIERDYDPGLILGARWSLRF